MRFKLLSQIGSALLLAATLSACAGEAGNAGAAGSAPVSAAPAAGTMGNAPAPATGGYDRRTMGRSGGGG